MKVLNYVIIFTFFILYLSCEDNITENKNLKNHIFKNISPTKTVLESQQILQYEVIGDKIFGIWPDHNNEDNISYLSKLKSFYGFNYLMIKPKNYHYIEAQNAGFDSEHLLVAVWNIATDHYRNEISTDLTWWGFYIDEPAYNYAHDPTTYWYYKPTTIISIHDDIKYYYGDNTKILMGTYRWWLFHNFSLDFFINYAPFADNILFTDYWDIPAGWDALRSTTLGTKFIMSWIRTDINQSQFYQLFNKANILNLKGIWAYQYDDRNISQRDNNLSLFCEAAWQNGWLRKHAINTYVKYIDYGNGWEFYNRYNVEEWM